MTAMSPSERLAALAPAIGTRGPLRTRRQSLPSPVKKRSVVIDGRKTSISLEDPFWAGLQTIAAAREISVFALVAEIHDTCGRNLSSAIRLHVLKEAQDRALAAS